MRRGGVEEYAMKRMILAAAVLALAGCGTTPRLPFGGDGRVAPTPAPQPVQPPPQAGGARPSVAVNATPQKVQDTIIARAQRRGTTIVGSNQTGVTLEAPLASSTEVVEQQCGPHRPGRTQRIYLETMPSGTGTIVSEDRFIVDDGSRSCQLTLTPADIEGANASLMDLKQQSEGQRVASNRPRTGGAAGSGGGAPRSADPAGGLEPLNPGRPVVPIR